MSVWSDQDAWDASPEEFKAHVAKAMAHLAGHGPHPGKYKGPQPDHQRDPDDVGESELAAQRLREIGAPAGPHPLAPLPPQEAISQPPPSGGKGKPAAKPPMGTTPAGLGAKAVEPETPSGNF